MRTAATRYRASNKREFHYLSHFLLTAKIQVSYECEYCHKMFMTPAQLTAHRWHHTKPFWCNHCDMRFAAKGNLVVHLRR